MTSNVRNQRNPDSVIYYSNEPRIQAICHFSRDKIDVYAIETTPGEVRLFYSINTQRIIEWKNWPNLIGITFSRAQFQFSENSFTISIIVMQSSVDSILRIIGAAGIQGAVARMPRVERPDMDAGIWDFGGGGRRR
jgi:hypothetical protein